ncbi:MAG: Hpt domain-containing protein [Candidatus Eisenbacteria bacterium]|uniref:Hpt domain-containing protein n=1 Tax=Eiseniibacteriota bacterium TaxID=2212470 RepID=A0A7Y2H125_UNCEI|nr:Hpt domain-containing protein [Candidatus Eisenbacteria bacterium]
MGNRDQVPLRFNFDRLFEVTSGDKNFEAKLVDEFIHGLPESVARLVSAIRNLDGDRALLESHALRGSAASLGAERLGQLSDHVHDMIGAGQLDIAMQQMKRLREESSAVVELLREYRLGHAA